MKKLFSVALVLALLLALSVPAFAEEAQYENTKAFLKYIDGASNVQYELVGIVNVSGENYEQVKLTYKSSNSNYISYFSALFNEDEQDVVFYMNPLIRFDESKLEQVLEAVNSINAQTTGLKLYVDESPLMFGLWSAGKGTYMDDIAGICGLTNIFADIEKHQAVSEEQVLERNPDIIITTNLFDPSWMTEMPADEIKGRAGWENISAIQNDMVVYDPTNAVAIPGPRLTEVAEMLFELVSGGEAEVPAA